MTEKQKNFNVDYVRRCFVSAVVANELVKKYGVSDEEIAEIVAGNMKENGHESEVEEMSYLLNKKEIFVTVPKAGYKMFEFPKFVKESEEIKARNIEIAKQLYEEAQRKKEERKVRARVENLKKQLAAKKEKNERKFGTNSSNTAVQPKKKKIIHGRRRPS